MQVHTLAAGSETGHCSEQLEAVRAAVARLNDVRLRVRIRCAGATEHPAARSSRRLLARGVHQSVRCCTSVPRKVHT